MTRRVDSHSADGRPLRSPRASKLLNKSFRGRQPLSQARALRQKQKRTVQKQRRHRYEHERQHHYVDVEELGVRFLGRWNIGTWTPGDWSKRKLHAHTDPAKALTAELIKNGTRANVPNDKRNKRTFDKQNTEKWSQRQDFKTTSRVRNGKGAQSKWDDNPMANYEPYDASKDVKQHYNVPIARDKYGIGYHVYSNESSPSELSPDSSDARRAALELNKLEQISQSDDHEHVEGATNNQKQEKLNSEEWPALGEEPVLKQAPMHDATMRSTTIPPHRS